jgi:hypothetical protein
VSVATRSASTSATCSPALMLCSLEFVGRRDGWSVAERLTPIAYVTWSLWLMATGVALLV